MRIAPVSCGGRGVIWNETAARKGELMEIAGLQKLSLVDYPGLMAATVFLPGCDFRCPFCHNASLVAPQGGAGFPAADEDAFWAFLEKRRGVLQGVCISGGEPLLRDGLAQLCGRIKEMGYRVKLDTNGAHPQRLAALIDAGLLDYAAMDVKASRAHYARAAGLRDDAAPEVVRAVQESARLLMEGPIAYEFRTTVVRELHDMAHLEAMADELRGAQAWYLQRYADSPDVLAGPGVLSAYDEAAMARIVERLASRAPFVRLRGV